MEERKLFFPRRQTRVGNVHVIVTVTSFTEPARQINFEGLVDTGAFGLILPKAWKERLAPFPQFSEVEVETADQRIVAAEVCSPVWIQIAGFRPIPGEAVFMEMKPGPHGAYEPLIGYTILELSGLVIDMVTHRLVARKYFDAKLVAHAAR